MKAQGATFPEPSSFWRHTPLTRAIKKNQNDLRTQTQHRGPWRTDFQASGTKPAVKESGGKWRSPPSMRGFWTLSTEAARGDIAGNIAGDIAGDIAGNIAGNIAGDFAGSVQTCLAAQARALN